LLARLSIEGDNALSIEVIQLVLNGGVLLVNVAFLALYVKTLKERVNFWKDKAEDLEKKSPEVIERVLSKRLKTATKELERFEGEMDHISKALEDHKQEFTMLNSDIEGTRSIREMW